jgi:hypothetical protein
MKARVLSLTLAALALCAAVRADILDVPLTPQEQTNWCWAACTKAVLGYYQRPVEQRQLAQFACFRNGWSSTACDCWAEPGGSTCNQANGICTVDFAGAIQNLLASWGLASTCGAGTCSFDTLVARIDVQHRPLVARLQKGQTGHFVVIRGATTDGSTQYVHCMNPWPPNVGAYTITTYPAFVNDGNWSWTHTL